MGIHDYQGLPGEPHPDNYGRDDDYRADHSKWQSSRASGKSTPSMPKNVVAHMKKEARLDDHERKAMYEEGRKAGKAEAKAKKPHMGPQFRSVKRKPIGAQAMLRGIKRGVRKSTYKAPNLGVQVRGKRRSH